MSRERADFASVYVALPTPFDERGKIDDKALDHLVDYLLHRDVAGIALLTEAAEDPLLSPQERRALIEQVGARTRGKKALWVAVSAAASREAMDLARHAEANGATGIFVAPILVPGLGYRELYRHVDRVGRATSLPTAVVVRPHNAADTLSPEELDTLSKHEKLAGVWLPEASAGVFKAWAKRFKDREAQVFAGCSLSFSASARAGATAVVCGLAMIATDHAARMAEAMRKGDVDGIRSLEKLTNPAVELLGPPRPEEEQDGVRRLATKLAQRSLEGSGLAPSVPFAWIKKGLELQGHPVKGHVRPPYEPVSDEQTERLRAVMKASGLLS